MSLTDESDSSPPQQPQQQQAAQQHDSAKQQANKPTYKPRQQPGSACEQCRKRKLRCDRKQPQCGVCADSGVACHIRTSCPPRGPKKGHLKILRSQIAALESRLDNREQGIATYNNLNGVAQSNHDGGSSYEQVLVQPNVAAAVSSFHLSAFDPATWVTSAPGSDAHLATVPITDNGTRDRRGNLLAQPLGISGIRSYLTDAMCGELDRLYFERVHHFAPILHRGRYLSWSGDKHKTKAQLCLQNAMWVLSAALAKPAQYGGDILYTETRQMLDALDMDESEGPARSLECVQAWLLTAMHEIMSNKIQRGLLSAGRALRLIQLQRLGEIDKPSNMGNSTPSDWTYAESARRTLWLAYILERFLAVNENLPLTLNEHEIRTRLPSTDAQFQNGQMATAGFLSEFLASTVAHEENEVDSFHMAPLTECVLIATTCGRSMVHKERSNEETFRQGFSPDFLRRHQWLDTVLGARLRTLSIRTIPLVFELPDPSLIFAALAAHTTILYLCTIVEATSNASSEMQISAEEYRQRATVAIDEICRLATTVKSLEHFQTHPLMPIPLLQCARFILAHTSSPTQCKVQLQELLEALDHLSAINSPAQDFANLIRSRIPEAMRPAFA